MDGEMGYTDTLNELMGYAVDLMLDFGKTLPACASDIDAKHRQA